MTNMSANYSIGIFGNTDEMQIMILLSFGKQSFALQEDSTESVFHL